MCTTNKNYSLLLQIIYSKTLVWLFVKMSNKNICRYKYRYR